MKGLIFKEFYCIKSKCLWKFYVFNAFVILLSVSAPLCSLYEFALIYFLLFNNSLLTCENDGKFDLTLPVSRAEVVSVKYIIVLAYISLGVLICLISGAIMLLTSSITVGEYLYGIAGLTLCGLPCALTLMPLYVFRKKGIIISSFLYLACGIVLIGFIRVRKPIVLNAVGFICIMAAAVALYALLWWVSVKAYSRREL